METPNGKLAKFLIQNLIPLFEIMKEEDYDDELYGEMRELQLRLVMGQQKQEPIWLNVDFVKILSDAFRKIR